MLNSVYTGLDCTVPLIFEERGRRERREGEMWLCRGEEVVVVCTVVCPLTLWFPGYHFGVTACLQSCC